jgi:hypothetical protein
MAKIFRYSRAVGASDERRQDERQVPFYRRLGAAGWSAIAGMIAAVAAVLALVLPGDGGDGSPNGPSNPSPQVEPGEAQRDARKAASEKVAAFGIFISPSEFAADCSLVGASAANEVWDCALVSGQCNGTVILTYQKAGLENTKNSVGCKE